MEKRHTVVGSRRVPVINDFLGGLLVQVIKEKYKIQEKHSK